LWFYFRILVIGIFIAVLGLGPAPHPVGDLFTAASRSVAAGEFLNVARSLAGVGEYYPWRVDLNLQAFRYALQAGDLNLALQYMSRPGVTGNLTADDQLLFADVYYKNGISGQAVAIWKNIIAQNGSPLAYQRLIDLYLNQGDYSSARNYMQELLSANPSDTRLYFQVGLLYAMTEPLEALPYLAQAAEVDPANASAALELQAKIRTANLSDHPAFLLLASGRQLASMGRWDYATEAFKHAAALDPGYADAWAFLGEALQQVSRQEAGSPPAAGLAELQQALQLDPISILANTFMALYWERQQDYSRSQGYLQQAITLDPSDPYLRSELGNVLSKSGDLPAAQSAYEAAIQLAPQDPLFYRLLAGFALEKQIQVRELALPAARQAIMLAPQDAASLDTMGQVMLMLQDYHSAERYLLEAVQSDPTFSPSFLHLGEACLYLSEPDLARQWFGKAMQVEPGSWVAAQASRMMEYYFP
jgi:tetratricopeptide (TPR) repeat protein